MQVRGPGPPGHQTPACDISASLRSLGELQPDIWPPPPPHRALAWSCIRPLESEIIITALRLALTSSPHSLSPLAALAAARALPAAAAADTTINIRTYSVADSFTSDLLGLLGPIEENKSNSRSINYFREFRLNIKSENKLYAGVWSSKEQGVVEKNMFPIFLVKN